MAAYSLRRFAGFLEQSEAAFDPEHFRPVARWGAGGFRELPEGTRFLRWSGEESVE